MGITTYNPATLEVTNQWFYNDFISVLPVSKQNYDFKITFKKDRKIDTMTFSSEYRADLLTEALQFKSQFAPDKQKETLVSI